MAKKLKVKTANQWLRAGRIVRNDAEPASLSPKTVYESWQTIKVIVATDPHGKPYNTFGDALLSLMLDHDCLYRADTGTKMYFEVERKNRKEIKQLMKRYELRWKPYRDDQIAISTQLKPS